MGWLSDLLDAYRLYRERVELKKHWIQFDIDLNLFKLHQGVECVVPNCNQLGKMETGPLQTHTHLAAIRLTFTNHGKTPVRIYNIQIWLSEFPPAGKIRSDPVMGRLKFDRLVTSGNIVHYPGKSESEAPFYYIGPGVRQTIVHPTLVSAKGQFIQVAGKFSLEQKRLFPKEEVGEMGLLPHTASRIYALDAGGNPVI